VQSALFGPVKYVAAKANEQCAGGHGRIVIPEALAQKGY
jgi:hypothetical protein